jgi:hypothetical protein|nr:MAG TPA: SH3-like domain protein [Caudoviricetes sp.]
MAKYKVGDRVKIVRNDYLTCEIGDTGTIMAYNSGTGYAVEFDIPRPSYHGCRGLTTPGYGQWASEENIELIEPIKDKPTREFKLIITSSGDTTTAKLIHGKTTTKEATVTRYSKDEYSEKAAVEAIVKKIFGEDDKENEANKPYNGKAVWISDNESVYTKGKIYKFVDGRIKHDLGFTIGGYTLENMKQSGCFIPIVE